MECIVCIVNANVANKIILKIFIWYFLNATSALKNATSAFKLIKKKLKNIKSNLIKIIC